MKKSAILLVILLLLSFNSNFAQLKIAYVDSETIMNELPDAQDAQKKLDQLVQEWQDELNKLKSEWKKAFDDYEKRKLILSNKKRLELEKELTKMEKEIADFRQKKFGANGELFKKQDEIMKPIQNKIFNVIQEIAKEEDYDFVFDRSGDVLFLFAKEDYDITALVLERLK